VGEATAISWTDHTFNPWWGCTRVSPGCQHCYAEAFAKRTGHDVWGTGDRRFFGDAHWAEPRKWDRQAEAEGRPHLVFCASMADVFEDRPELVEPRGQLFELIERTPHLIWQLLTKRPENVMPLAPEEWVMAGCEFPPNVWIGTTVEDQQRADERISHLLEVPAPVRFLSCEPLLGPVVLPSRTLLPDHHLCRPNRMSGQVSPKSRSAMATMIREVGHRLGWRGIDWVICGGESGAGHRPLELDHARSLRDQCRATGVPFFFKQVGGQYPTSGGDLLDGERLHAMPAPTNSTPLMASPARRPRSPSRSTSSSASSDAGSCATSCRKRCTTCWPR
jgi:protein gp37